ncbi:MAG: hypothetical protein QM673_16170 [Gordonia sp. (in: high G+C Gram-positive bacteria)]
MMEKACVVTDCENEAVLPFQVVSSVGGMEVEVGLDLCRDHKRAMYASLGTPALFEDGVVVSIDAELASRVMAQYVNLAVRDFVEAHRLGDLVRRPDTQRPQGEAVGSRVAEGDPRSGRDSALDAADSPETIGESGQTAHLLRSAKNAHRLLVSIEELERRGSSDD